jgi:alpha-L-fucosidase
MIYLVNSRLDSTKELVSLQLPADTTGIHIFSLSMLPAISTENMTLEVQMARSTQKWIADNKNTQIIEVIINNVGSQWVQGEDAVQVSVQSPSYKTVRPVTIKRLRPGDQVKVEVGVITISEAGSSGNATVIVSGRDVHVTYDFQATFGVVPYQATFDSIYSHESPKWFDDSKYGIFIHWGLFSLPAWGNSGPNETYAEWYIVYLLPTTHCF